MVQYDSGDADMVSGLHGTGMFLIYPSIYLQLSIAATTAEKPN